MYLKSIEIQGFKSFAKKITLDLKNGITGIVGPNGSGKSNIADALRWVLGEQKVKSLRGSKMEDVIFAGTEKRNPLSFAYVAITFDNSDKMLAADSSEVKVARKLYRSGESEYLLNGSPVRLKDIKELFYDTGIGKEGYSIIGQGQIDKILNNKSDERRELFDEACGIVKYKKRKAVAIKKLENERLDLERTNDIIKELEKRLPSLKRQSESANNFLDYKNELKSLEIDLFLQDSDRLKEKIKDCERKEKIASDELVSCEKELEEIRAEHEKASADLSALDDEIEKINNEIARADIAKESITGRINVLNEQINSAKESESHISERRQAILTSIKSAEDEKTSLEAEKEENIKKLDAAEEYFSSVSRELLSVQNELAALNEKSEELKEALVENVRKKGDASAALERLKANVEQIEKRKLEIAAAVKEDLENRQKQSERIRSLEEEVNAQTEKVNSIEKDIEEISAKLLKTEQEEEQTNSILSSARLDGVRAKTRLENIRNITERYEGYSGAIKEVMALKGKYKGIYGVVADIIKTSKEYETAIETALGGSIQNIVTDDENTAKQAIEYLKAGRLGRATFLPLKAIKSRGAFRNEEALYEEGAIGLASSLVNAEHKYINLCDYLLGRILVADNIDNALKIAKKYRYSFVIVTLEGELLSRGGAISGGAYKNRSNLLGRRREIEELENEISRFDALIKKNERSLENLLKGKADLKEELSKAEVLLQEKRILLNTINVNLLRARSDESDFLSSLESAKELEKEIALENEGIRAETDKLTRLLEENEKRNEDLKKSIALAGNDISAKKTEEGSLLARQKDSEIELSRLKEHQSFLISSAIKAENNISALREELKSLENSLNGPVHSSEEKLEEIRELNISLKRIASETSSFKIKLADLYDRRSETKEGSGDFLDRNDELSEQIASLDKEIFRLDQLKEKYEEQLDSRAEHIWHEYELTYSSALSLKTDMALSADSMNNRISELKRKIRELGTINVSAIEEYKEVNTRFEFLSGQRDDILKAEDNILKMIKDLDRQMKARFKKEFSKIDAEFSRVFKIMFGGGYGSVTLENEDDILESDVLITAQPPGKKLQNMMQLSGGEKALTAIAVLFAIQNLKPSPFCVLDEIEAALDDSNITKFSNYLTLLSGKIQFIVITHRKGTMEACDRLYGITMQEKGVSTLVSVSLEEAKDTMSDERARTA